MNRLIFFLLLVAVSLPALAQESAKPTSVSVFVSDQESNPVGGADVELLIWGGTWKPSTFKGITDQAGKLEFSGIPSDAYLSLFVRHSDFAPRMNDFTAASGDKFEIKSVLYPAAHASIAVTDPDGKPLPGALISRLEVTQSDLKMVFGDDVVQRFSGRPLESDVDGNLPLPPLAAGSRISFQVIHPDWASDWVEDVEVQSGVAGTAKLHKGTRVQMKLSGDPEAVSALENQLVQIRLFSDDSELGTRVKKYLIHGYHVESGGIAFGVHRGKYSQMDFNADGFFLTPKIFERYPAEASDVQKFDSENLEYPMLVRTMKKRRGRVVLADGQPVSDITISLASLNLIPGENNDLKSASVKWATVGFTTTDTHGAYEIDMPDGFSVRHIQSGGYFVDTDDDDEFEFEIESGQDKLPDFVVQPLPVIHGIVQDQNGLPMEKTILRILNARPETSCVLTDEKGEFTIPVSWKPRGENASISLIAFDPGSDRGQVAKVNLENKSEFSNVRLELAPQEPDWLLEFIGSGLPENSEFNIEEYQAKHPDRKPGAMADDLSAGTWLNTDAKSLVDFRGKYVLLDFWFIGCGPCIRDMPTVSMAHELFGGKNFSVVSVHINSQPPDQVQQFADSLGAKYPIVVDNAAGDISEAYKKLGVDSYPNYILIGPDGRVVWNDNYPNVPDLRNHKLEVIQHFMMTQSRSQE